MTVAEMRAFLRTVPNDLLKLEQRRRSALHYAKSEVETAQQEFEDAKLRLSTLQKVIDTDGEADVDMNDTVRTT